MLHTYYSQLRYENKAVNEPNRCIATDVGFHMPNNSHFHDSTMSQYVSAEISDDNLENSNVEGSIANDSSSQDSNNLQHVNIIASFQEKVDEVESTIDNSSKADDVHKCYKDSIIVKVSRLSFEYFTYNKTIHLFLFLYLIKMKIISIFFAQFVSFAVTI